MPQKRTVGGVVGIINNTEVKPTVAPIDIKSKIEQAPLRSAGLDARRISVEVEGSTVKLYGSVLAWAEKEEAERAAGVGEGQLLCSLFISILVQPRQIGSTAPIRVKLFRNFQSRF